MMKVLIDTDIIIDYSKGKSNLLRMLFERQSRNEIELFINPVIISEFFTDNNLKDIRKYEKAREMFCNFSISDITCKEGYQAGEYLREKRILFLNDAIIAATCVLHNMQLATRNIKHFSKIENLQFYQE